MSDGPIPRLDPYQVLQVIDQIRAEAEQAQQLVVWKHTGVCDGFTEGIWQPSVTCSRCHFEVDYRDHIEQFLLLPVSEPGQQPMPGCMRCLDRGVVPDFQNWDDYHGEPKPKPCPACRPPSQAAG